MKSKKVIVYKDHVFESEVVSQVTAAAERMTELVKAFNALEMGNVQPNEIETLVRKPQALYDKRLLLIEVPKGLSRVKYLQLCELPSLDMVLQLRDDLLRNPHCMSFELFSLEGEQVTVNQSELTDLLNTRNIYLDRDSEAFSMVTKVVQFVRDFNDINAAVNYALIRPEVRNPLMQYFDIRELEGSFKYRLVLNRDKLQQFIKIFNAHTVKIT